MAEPPKGKRLRAGVLHGRWKTTTFCRWATPIRLTAPMVLEGPINLVAPGLCRSESWPGCLDSSPRILSGTLPGFAERDGHAAMACACHGSLRLTE